MQVKYQSGFFIFAVMTDGEMLTVSCDAHDVAEFFPEIAIAALIEAQQRAGDWINMEQAVLR